MHDSENVKPIGRVVGLWRYPVKSMAGEKLAEVDVSWHGFAGDRRWAFIRDGVVQSGFRWLTIRQRENMNHYRPSFVEPARPDKSPAVVRTPSGAVLDVADPALGSELCPGGARVIKQDRGVFDAFPLSLITTRTIARLGEIVGTDLDVQRFRPNLLVEADDETPFVEDRWVGRVLRAGGLRMRVDKRDSRCVVITTDPVTGERNPEILRVVARDRQGCLGVDGSTVEPGGVRVGQRIVMGDIPREFAEQFTFTVVGVVGEVRHDTLETMARPAAYFPFSQATTGHHGDWGMTLMIRTAGDPLALAESVRAEIGRLAPTLPVFDVRSMLQAVELSKAARRFQLQLVAAFALVALVLAAVGIYGVMAYSVSRRTRELGIRLALGARAGDVVRQILREGMVPVAAGLLFGLAGALVLVRVLSSFLFGIEPVDTRSFLSGAAVLATVAVIACLIPAWRATGVDPAVTLRYE